MLYSIIVGYGNATPSAEFNWFSDPEAAYNVLKSFPSPTIVPLETCSKYGFTWVSCVTMMFDDKFSIDNESLNVAVINFLQIF